MGFIYKITNTINGKVYIGQTIRDINCRWSEHLRHAYNQNDHEYETHLYRSMRKYGKENFSIQQIEKCNIEDLDEREIFWIDFYRSYDENYGYNMTLGGSGTRRLEYDEIFARYDSGESLAEIAEHMHIGRSNLTQILKGYESYNCNDAWERSKKYLRKKKGSAVVQYDLDGNFIAEFESAKEAELLVEKSSRQNIMKCCKAKRGTSGGFQWRFKNDPPPERCQCTTEPKVVYQMDLTLNVINVFPSIYAASLKTGIQRDCISRCCNGKAKLAGGYTWKFAKDFEEL